MKKQTVSGESVVDLSKIDETSSTVYIPEHLQKGLEGLMKQKGLSLRDLLRHLLDGYSVVLSSGNLPASKKGKKLYQKKGLDLERMDFRPANGDWAKLTTYAHSLGYARNLLFVRLLAFELLREELMRTGIPTKLLAFFSKKVKKLIHLSYNELLDAGQILRRKFEHVP